MMKIKRYGWRPDRHDARDYRFTPKLSSKPLPPSVDMRHSMPGVYDQGDAGSCTGNAIAGAIEYCMRKERVTELVPSRLFIYYNERVIEGTVDQDAGAEIRDGIKSVAEQGVCSESMYGTDTWPYNIANLTVKPTQACYDAALKDIVKTYARVDQTLDGVRGCLASGFPVVFGFTVYESFESEAVARNGVLNLPVRGEKIVGGHAVLAVGYNDTQRRIIVRNSWGTGWGMGGYFTMPYAYILNGNLANDLWQIDVVQQKD